MAGGLETAGARLSPAKLGMQLSTVRSVLDRDFLGTLRHLAAMGYREVETLGAHGKDPAEVRDFLHAAGLVSPSQFIAPANAYQETEAC